MIWLGLLALAQADPCEDYGRPQLLLRLQTNELLESSGLAASRHQDGRIFTHNDSGSPPVLYSFSTDGGAVKSWPLLIEAYDLEDMAAGPCPGGGNCLYVGDIGDNARARESIQVFAFRETEFGAESVPMAMWDVRYPGTVQDAESLLVHPVNGSIYVVTKRSQGAQVFRVPRESGEGVLSLVAELSPEKMGFKMPKLTGGDFSRDGKRVVLRGYLSAWEWVVNPQKPEAHWLGAPERKVGIRLERQGEAITYDLTGRLFTSSEGQPMPLTRIGCRR
jgi:hypothetical protein